MNLDSTWMMALAESWAHAGLLGYAWVFALAALLGDALIGDPVYRFHPVRVLGRCILFFEKALRQWGWDGLVGGVVLWIGTVIGFLLGYGAPLFLLSLIFPDTGVEWKWTEWKWVWDLYWAVSLLAYRDLVVHVRRVDTAANAGQLEEARFHASRLVGRDTDRLSFGECRRAALESLAENWIDGVLAPLFFLLLAGVPGLIIFKAASTLDSMVGYRNERYEKFGKISARIDDLLCWIPARLGFLLLCLAAVFVPGASARRAWTIGRSQHPLIPGPNPGWAEATAAGAIRRRLIGPIEKAGKRVTEIWIGHLSDPPAGSTEDVQRMIRLTRVATLIFMASSGIGIALLIWLLWILN